MNFFGLNSLQSNKFEADISNAISSASTPITIEETQMGWTIPWYVWLIFILLFAFIAFNIFIYLAKGKLNDISNFFNIIKEKSQSLFGISTKQATPINKTEIAKETTQQGAKFTSTIPQQDKIQEESLYKALNSTQAEKQELNPMNSSTEYAADDSSSTIQKTKSANKSGWCYIGEDRGFRSCIKVNEGDKCMSGSIFPSQDICVNPNLRV